MEYILLQDVPVLGKRGAVVKVAPGYARNYLLPRGLVVRATPKSKADVAAAVARAAKNRDRVRAEAEAVAARLGQVALAFLKLANENGELYGSLAAVEIAQTLAEQGFDVDKKNIIFDEPVARLGLFAVRVVLAEGVEVAIPVTVAAPPP